jgi:hypothetical protein
MRLREGVRRALAPGLGKAGVAGLLLATHSLAAGVAYVQQTGNASTTGSAFNTTFASPCAAGDSIMVGVNWQPANAAPPVLTDSLGNMYVVVVGPIDGGFAGSYAQSLSLANRIDGGSLSINATGSGLSFLEVIAAEYSGLSPNSPVESSGYTTGGADPALGPLLSMAAPGDLVFAYLVDNAGASVGADGMTVRRVVNGDLIEDVTGADAGTFQAVQPASMFNRWALLMAALRPDLGDSGTIDSGTPVDSGAPGDSGTRADSGTPAAGKAYAVGCSCDATGSAPLGGLLMLTAMMRSRRRR